MTLAGDRDTLKTQLETITGMRSYDVLPETINQLPCAVVRPASANYDFNLARGQMIRKYEVTLLVAYQGSLEKAQDALDAYLEATGASSVKAVIESGSFSPGYAYVRGWRDYMLHEYGGSKYLGVVFDVTIQ